MTSQAFSYCPLCWEGWGERQVPCHGLLGGWASQNANRTLSYFCLEYPRGMCGFSKMTYYTPLEVLLEAEQTMRYQDRFLTCHKHYHHFSMGVLLPDCTLITPAQALVLDVNSPKIGNEGFYFYHQLIFTALQFNK